MLTRIPQQSLQLLMLLLTVRPGPGFALPFLGTSTSSVNQEFNSKPSTPVGPAQDTGTHLGDSLRLLQHSWGLAWTTQSKSTWLPADLNHSKGIPPNPLSVALSFSPLPPKTLSGQFNPGQTQPPLRNKPAVNQGQRNLRLSLQTEWAYISQCLGKGPGEFTRFPSMPC